MLLSSLTMSSLEQALAFIKTLKRNFSNFESLAEALVDFREGNTDTAALVLRISELVHGHRDLIAGFNNFLPEKHRLPISSADQPTQPQPQPQPQLSLKRRREVVKHAIEFVNKVRKTSKDDEIYTSFLRVVTDFQAHRNIVRVDKEISALFKANPELYIDFTWFAAPDDLGVSSTRRAAKKALAPEKTLEKCENDLYKSDMAFHAVESTKKATEKLLKEREEKGNRDGGINVKDYYSAMNMRCIKEVYGDYKEDKSLDLLHRLNEKLEEVRKKREEVKKRCAETMRNCYRKTQRRKEQNLSHS